MCIAATPDTSDMASGILRAPEVCRAIGVRQTRQALAGLTEADTGCRRFHPSSECEGGRYYRMAYGTGLSPNKIRRPLLPPPPPH